MTHIHLRASLTDGWFVERLGRGRPNPVTASLKDMAYYEQDRTRVLYDHLGEFGMGSPDPELHYTVP